MSQVRRSTRVRAQGGSHRTATTIDMLPDNVLLEIFDFYRSQSSTLLEGFSHYLVWKWHLLVHVCRRWRQIVLESPLRLDLQILCTHRTPVRKNLSIWPALPIAINYRSPRRSKKPFGQGNRDVIAALKQTDRVCYVGLNVTGPQLGRMATVMQRSFPVLTQLHVASNDGDAPVLPARFLGGSAPCLKKITLSGISYPALPTLLLSTSNLVALNLLDIPPTGYISPEAVVACLAALPSLELLTFECQSVTPRPDRIHLPPIPRIVLPALTTLILKGASEYLEDLVARINGPQLDEIFTIYLNPSVDIQVDQLSKFIDCSVGPELDIFKHAHVDFNSNGVVFFVQSHASLNRHLTWNSIFYGGIDWQPSHTAQVLSQFSAALSNVIHLKLTVGLEEDCQLEGMDDIEWLHLLRQFSTAQTLHVSPKLAGHIALALEDITAEMVTELMPSLDLICVEGQPASSIKKFVTACRLSGRPVTVTNTEMEFDRRLEFYFSR